MFDASVARSYRLLTIFRCAGDLVRQLRQTGSPRRRPLGETCAGPAGCDTVYSYSMSVTISTPYFYCRICGSREYERVVVRRHDGKPYETAFYACMGCTTLFGDPTKYSPPPPPLKVTRVDAPISFRRSRGVHRFGGRRAGPAGGPGITAASGPPGAPARRG
jgi:hypothetical protein